MDLSDRACLNFGDKARKAFAFLVDQGFSVEEILPTLVRYRKGDIEVDVYHGRQSYEIGAEISASGIRYSMSEIIRFRDVEIAKNFRYAAATTAQGVTAGLEELSTLMKRYGCEALKGNAQFFLELEKQRRLWSKEYALDVLVEQLRPQANEAFHRKDYSVALELYARIRERLSPAELKKLRIAEERKKDR